jgi:hypothetical protein
MTSLIISDIHERWEKIRRILEKYEPETDHTYFLGDWYDYWTFSMYDVENTATLHKESLNSPRRTVFWGNHDMPYRYRSIRGLQCSGHDPLKYSTLDRILKPEDWAKTKFCEYVDGYLLSHAGIHNWYLQAFSEEQKVNTLEEILHKVLTLVKECKYDLDYEVKMHFLVGAGRARYGNQKFGGITWLDFEKEFQPVPNLNQIVGHTHRDKVRTKHSEALNSKNYCIDTDSNHIAIINDNRSVSIIDVSDV